MNLRKYVMVVIGIVICSISFSVFFVPYDIVPNGVAGMAILFRKLFSINEAITISLLSLMFLIIGCLFLEKDDVKKSILGTILFPLFIYLFNILAVKIDLSIDNTLLTSIVGGVTFGFGLGLIYREDAYIGGIDLFNRILARNNDVDYSVVTLVMDAVIVILGWIVFGFSTFVYSFVAIFICRLMIEKVRVGIGDNRSFYIITTHPNEIKKIIIDELGHGATILKGKGAYSNGDKYIIFVAIPKRDYYKLRDNIKKIDENAFFVASTSYEVGGGK